MNPKIKSNTEMVSSKGFTLLEILIALFIFTIVSMILVSALHTVMNSLIGTETNADQLRKLQSTLLVMSRDVEQIVYRPVLDTSGNEEAAFLGTPRMFTFTHLGYVNLTSANASRGMQRTRYFWEQNTLWRMTWPVLDQAPGTRAHTRSLLENVSEVRFQYLDQEGRFQDNWPVEGQVSQQLPRAVRIILTISNWGKISQLYVVQAKASQNIQSTNNPARQSEAEQEP